MAPVHCRVRPRSAGVGRGTRCAVNSLGCRGKLHNSDMQKSHQLVVGGTVDNSGAQRFTSHSNAAHSGWALQAAAAKVAANAAAQDFEKRQKMPNSLGGAGRLHSRDLQKCQNPIIGDGSWAHSHDVQGACPPATRSSNGEAHPCGETSLPGVSSARQDRPSSARRERVVARGGSEQPGDRNYSHNTAIYSQILHGSRAGIDSDAMPSPSERAGTPPTRCAVMHHSKDLQVISNYVLGSKLPAKSNGDHFITTNAAVYSADAVQTGRHSACVNDRGVNAFGGVGKIRSSDLYKQSVAVVGSGLY